MTEFEHKKQLTHAELVGLLNSKGEEEKNIFEHARRIKSEQVGDVVYLRGLIEMSNQCRKDCLYCGIRKGNPNVSRYELSNKEVLEMAQYAWEKKFGSIVIQSGELNSPRFVERVTGLLKSITELTQGEIKITLSMGEQEPETYQKWFEAGAHRYLLRIETSDKDLYHKIHPVDNTHSFETRIECLKNLISIGYQTGTGVMIGLPFQTIDHLASDLMFMLDIDIHMVGMGPYIEHKATPLYQFKHLLLPLNERFQLSLKMIAILRILMKDINIAASTAMQTIDPMGREKAIQVGANVMMPNITPGMYRKNYELYENKPCTDENADDCSLCMEMRVSLVDNRIAWGEWGNSKHYFPKLS